MKNILSQPSPQVNRTRYQPPLSNTLGFFWSIIIGRPRSLSNDARTLMANIKPEMEVVGVDNIPSTGPCLITCNHYTRPGFAAWWFVFAISAVVASKRSTGADCEIHWVVAEYLRYSEYDFRRWIVTPFTRWLMRMVSKCWEFITMPPMPPSPEEVVARAIAIKQTLRLARNLITEGGMIGLAPEGRDFPGRVGEPPEGVGHFIALLVQTGWPILPVGVTEQQGRLRVAFGKPYSPDIPERRADLDSIVSQQVMSAIKQQMV